MCSHCLNIHCSYFLFCFGISVDDLKGGYKACDIFLTSFISSLSVLMTLDATSLDKSSTLKNCTSGNTIDMVVYYCILSIYICMSFIVFYNPRINYTNLPTL